MSVSLTSVCLSRTSGLSREQRDLGRPKFAEVVHVTRDSDTAFKVKSQGHQTVMLTAVLARQAAVAVSVGTCWPWETAATLYIHIYMQLKFDSGTLTK